MARTDAGSLRRAPFLGAKVRTLRKRAGMTLEELSMRCVQIDREAAPSVSYLSMIERGKRMPSPRVLELLAGIFQQPATWFLDREIDAETPLATDEKMSLQPSVLFSPQQLQAAIPELLSQTGITGRKFAQLLIRSYQEAHRNRLPDIERAAEEVGGKEFPDEARLLALVRRHGLKVRWFEREPDVVPDADPPGQKTLLRSFFEPPNRIYLNRVLERQHGRLKYDLASHLAHRVLHGGDGRRSSQITGAEPQEVNQPRAGNPLGVDAGDIFLAWRDFECSVFAGALLCPRAPFRRLLIRHGHDVAIHEMLDVTPALVMRRMTSVSPYAHWHYFDAYPPGRLRAVYRGNGIPLPWGNMRDVSDPCRQWAVFRMLSAGGTDGPHAQLSVLREERGDAHLYCCLSLRTQDAAGNSHVICAGIDLAPALRAEGLDADALVRATDEACVRGGGAAPAPATVRTALSRIASAHSIKWIEEGMRSPARIICPRSAACPRPQVCARRAAPERRSWLEQVRREILSASG
jgi:transcriptional regulator with XRE-family HTH domain